MSVCPHEKSRLPLNEFFWNLMFEYFSKIGRENSNFIKIYMEWKPTDVTILFVYCWVCTCFGPTGPSSGEFVQLFTQPLVQYLSALDACSVCCGLSWWLFSTLLYSDRPQHTEHVSRAERYWTNGCVNSCTNSPEDGHVGPKHVETQQYTNKIVTSVGFHSIRWKDARYKKLKIH